MTAYRPLKSYFKERKTVKQKLFLKTSGPTSPPGDNQVDGLPPAEVSDKNYFELKFKEILTFKLADSNFSKLQTMLYQSG